jgi:hypothetical protein
MRPLVSIWPESAGLLLAEISRTPGRLALAVDDRDRIVTGALALYLGANVWHAGSRLLDDGVPQDDRDITTRLTLAGPVIDDLDLLFWRPWLDLDPLALMRTVARLRPGVVFTWPGTIEQDQAIYSSPGRRDYYQGRLSDAVVLRPVVTVFPDEQPYRIERFV